MKLNKHFSFTKLHKNKKYFIHTFILLLILLCSIYNFYKYKYFIDEFKSDFDNYNFSDANNTLLTKQLYNPFKLLFLKNDLNAYFDSKLNTLYTSISDNNISDEDALLQIKEINRYSILSKDKLLYVSNSVYSIKNSNITYTNGLNYYYNENYLEAINTLKKVSPLDLNYDDTLKYIDKSKNKLKETLFADCDELAKKDYYSKAISKLTDNKNIIGNGYDVQEKISELKSKQQAYYDKQSETAEASSYALSHDIIPDNINSLNIESTTPYFINVNLSNQTTYIYKGKINKWKLIRTCPCSTGTDEENTPSGSFSTKEKGTWFFSEKYNQGGKYWTQITGDILFHSLPFARDKSTVLDYTLNVPASHGCIRLSIDDAKWIYTNIPRDSKVIIK